MSKETMVLNSIKAKTENFDFYEIAREANVSPGYALNIINRLISEQKIIRIKDGRRSVYRFLANTQLNPEISDTNSDMRKLCSVDEMFSSIETLVSMVANNKSPSVLVTGLSGIGKTYIVTKTLESSNTEYVVIKGHSSPLGLYGALYENNGKVIVFDDCDSIFGNDIATNILKGALDSYAKRYISWLGRGINENSDLPNSFEFTGRIIFISNLDQSKIDEAIKSRTFCINISLSRREITERLESLMDDIEPSIKKSIKEEVLEFIHEYRDSFAQYNIRTFIKAIRIRSNCANDSWKTIVRITN